LYVWMITLIVEPRALCSEVPTYHYFDSENQLPSA
jgi:hypothetical protein